MVIFGDFRGYSVYEDGGEAIPSRLSTGLSGSKIIGSSLGSSAAKEKERTIKLVIIKHNEQDKSAIKRLSHVRLFVRTCHRNWGHRIDAHLYHEKTLHTV